MTTPYFHLLADENFKALYALFGFEIPFLPEPLSADGFGIALQQEHAHLLNQQIRFLRMFYPQPKADISFEAMLGTSASDEKTALELRIIAGDNGKNTGKKLRLYIMGRVSIANAQGDIRQNAARISRQTIKYAQEIQAHIMQTFPLEYTLRPLTKEEWANTMPIDLSSVHNPQCTAEIRKYTERSDTGEIFAYPFYWSSNTYTQLCKLLLTSSQTLVLSVGLQPTNTLSREEKKMLQSLAVDTAPVDVEGINNEFLRQMLKKQKGPKSRSADYYLQTLHKPFLSRIQLISDQPIPASLLQAIGEEISPTQDSGEDKAYFGVWQPFQHVYPERSELGVALDNFKYIKRDFWGDKNHTRLQYLVGATEANAAFRIPLGTPYGIPGVDTVPFNPFVARQRLTNYHSRQRLVRLGLDTHGEEFSIDANSLTRHALIVGSTGSGKTTTSQQLLSEIWKHQIPFFVIEPAKSEYRHFLLNEKFTQTPERDILLFTLGDSLSPFHFNPLEIPLGVSVSVYISALKSCFMAAFPMGGPLPLILERVIRESYEIKGWHKNHIVTGNEDKPFPTLSDLHQRVEELLPTLGYSGDVRSTLDAALRLRLKNLLDGLPGQILNTEKPQPWHWEDLLKRPVLFEMEAIVDDDEKALLIAFVFTILSFYRKKDYEARQTTGEADLTHVTFIEEAHRIFANPGFQNETESVTSKTKAINTFTNMLAEMRAYGEGIIIAEQIPTKLSRDIIKHPDLKIMHRITAHEDRQVLGTAMNFSERHRQYITTLKRGLAAIYVEGLFTPTLVQIYPPKRQRVPSSAEIFERMAVETLTKLLKDIQNRIPGAGVMLDAYAKNLAIRARDIWGINGDEFIDFIQRLLQAVVVRDKTLEVLAQDVSLRYEEMRGK